MVDGNWGLRKGIGINFPNHFMLVKTTLFQLFYRQIGHRSVKRMHHHIIPLRQIFEHCELFENDANDKNTVYPNISLYE